MYTVRLEHARGVETRKVMLVRLQEYLRASCCVVSWYSRMWLLQDRLFVSGLVIFTCPKKVSE